jgi:hypothetical protein
VSLAARTCIGDIISDGLIKEITTLPFVSFAGCAGQQEGVKELMAQKVIERREAHYETREVPFGKVYEWHPACVVLECDCGEKLILTATSTTTTCRRCGDDLGGFVHDIQEREGRLPDELTHPWFYDARGRARQRLRDEAAYPEGSPWRYNDITGDP